jgi:murein DD-endopeptidase MepM/ murein hydrolase activator NlpD
MTARTSLALIFWALASAGSGRSQSTATATVSPGSVVRWIGDGTTLCRLGGEDFVPRDGACLFPIDLQANEALVASRVRAGIEERLALRIGAYPYDVQRLTIADQGYVDLSPENAARAEREAARIAKLWSRRGPALDGLPLSAPLVALPSGGRFGSKRIINGEPRSPHTGADYSADQGTPVLAPADAIVALAEEHFFSGNAIFLDHGDGLITMVFHLHEIFVEPGERVTRGAVIGTVGSTGRSTGPHLHFGARWRGARVDPRPLLAPVEGLASIP